MAATLTGLLVKLKICWENLSHLRQSRRFNFGLGMDLISIGAGIRPVADPERWKRYCLGLYRLMGYYQFIMSLAQVGFSSRNPDTLATLFEPITTPVFIIIALVKEYIVETDEATVQQLKTFLRSNTRHSGDQAYDASVRQDATRTIGKAAWVIFCIICCDQVLLWVPNSTRDRFIGISKQFQMLGTVVAELLNGLYVSSYIVVWGSRYYYSTLTIMSMLAKLRSELMIVAHGLEKIETCVHDKGLTDPKSVEGASRKLKTDNKLRWRYLKSIFGNSVGQHVEVLR